MVKHFTFKIHPSSVFSSYRQKTNYPRPCAEMDLTFLLPLGWRVSWDPGQASDLLLSNEAEEMQKSPLSQGGYFPNSNTGLLSPSTHPSQTALEQLWSQLNCPDLEITFKELWQVNFIFQSNWHIILILNQIFQLIHWFPSGLRPQHTYSPLGDLMRRSVDYSRAFSQLQETLIQLLFPKVGSPCLITLYGPCWQ